MKTAEEWMRQWPAYKDSAGLPFIREIQREVLESAAAVVEGEWTIERALNRLDELKDIYGLRKSPNPDWHRAMAEVWLRAGQWRGPFGSDPQRNAGIYSNYGARCVRCSRPTGVEAWRIGDRLYCSRECAASTPCADCGSERLPEGLPCGTCGMDSESGRRMHKEALQAAFRVANGGMGYRSVDS